MCEIQSASVSEQAAAGSRETINVTQREQLSVVARNEQSLDAIMAVLKAKIAEAEKERLQIAEERERIEYEMAIENLEKLILKSPLKGVITELLIDEGENCESNQPLVHVVDYSKCNLVCYIEATLSENLKKGQSVDLEIPVGARSVRRKGRIIFISPVVDPASDLTTVKVEFDNQDGTVRPGVAASMLIPGS